MQLQLPNNSSLCLDDVIVLYAKTLMITQSEFLSIDSNYVIDSSGDVTNIKNDTVIILFDDVKFQFTKKSNFINVNIDSTIIQFYVTDSLPDDYQESIENIRNRKTPVMSARFHLELKDSSDTTIIQYMPVDISLYNQKYGKCKWNHLINLDSSIVTMDYHPYLYTFTKRDKIDISHSQCIRSYYNMIEGNNSERDSSLFIPCE